MTNNFKQIRELLKFESEDDFYHLQILKRKKENPELGSNSATIKTYYIRSLEYLDKLEDEIINSCNSNNARAYINLNRRSFEKIAFHTLRKVTDIIMNKDFKSVRNAYDSVCGSYSNEKNKNWIVDIDNKDFEIFEEGFQYELEISRFINTLKPEGDKIITKIETKNGCHLITRPFNVTEFKKLYPQIDIHKDNPTILYIA
jgi:hypothetical protein